MRSGRAAGPSDLRRRAEERLGARREAPPHVEASEDVRRLIHELQVHQVELELQNEELRRARDELEASATRYAELYDFAPVSYLTLDSTSTILEINLVGATLLGRDRARLIGQRFSSWVTPATRPALEGLLAALHGEERACCDLTLTGTNGPVFVRLDALPEPPTRATVWRCRAALTDVTQVKAAAQLRESDRRKSDFLAVLSHELRNPLAPITNAIHLLEALPPGDEHATRARAIIERQTAQLTRLVDDLLDMTRIERGKVDLKPEMVDLARIARDACDDHRATFEQRGVRLYLPDPSLPVNVRGDPARLAQIMGNLLQNAAKFTPAGGAVTVLVSGAGGWAELRVRDTGVGVAPDQIDRLFEPFAQVAQGLARTQGGLGLGLSLVKGLVELHGGTVTATSDGLGRGVELVVALPLALLSPASRPPEVQKLQVRSIVVIEDNADAAETFGELLALDGHHVQIASDGRSGLELVRRLRPEFVFCDLGLPDLSGFEVATLLRADEALRATQLVAISGYALPEDLERSREAGFDAHLPKPPDLGAVNALLARGSAAG